MFHIQEWMMQSSAFVPQDRRRLYTVGWNWYALRCVPVPPPMPLRAAVSRATLADVLHRGLPLVDEASLTPQQKLNLAVVKNKLLASFQTSGEGWATFSVDRNPYKGYNDPLRRDGCVNTLRTHNELTWVLYMDRLGEFVFSRCLHPVERCALQGFRPELANLLSKSGLVRATGNSFTVPVVVAVFGQCLKAFVHASSLSEASVPRPISYSQRGDHENVVSVLRKTRMLNIERHKIAILDCEAKGGR